MSNNKSSLQAEIGLIEKFLRDYKINASVNKSSSFVAGRSFAVLGLALGGGVRIATIENRMGELSELISAYRGRPTPVRLRKLPLSIEIPHPALEPLFPTWSSLDLPAHSLLLGKSYGYDGERDETISLLDSPHLLVAGTAGSGKSRLLELLIYSLALNTSPADLRMVFVDMKNEDLVQFKDLLHCEALALSLPEAVDAICGVWSEKEKRVKGGQGKYRRLVLVIDELAELSRSSEIMGWLASVLAIGRSKNINVIAATQKPTAKVVGSVAKANFTTRLVGKVLGANDAEVAAGMPGTGAHLLPGKGSFLNVRGDQQQRFQAYLLDDDAGLERLRTEQGGVRLADVQQIIRNRWVAQLPLALAHEGEIHE